MGFTTDLKKAGLKTTRPRLKILNILETAEVRHLSAEDVYKILLESGDEIGPATVYRVLTQFEGAGLVIRHNFEGGRSVFELNDESHHDHMVCPECGRVFEFFDRTIEERQRQIAEQAGFTIDDHSLYLYGVCRGFRDSGKCSWSDKLGEGIFRLKQK
ncbi:MAG: ferric iron uptake transcriptional regulator [Gammaproteobacteria bacterium]|nr:ferric iron uptake transcriptional regulator [Gammaproteobacteria bacterium]